MPSPSPQPRSPLRTHTARVKTKTPVNQLCPGHREGVDDETQTSDFPVEGELFLLTSPFIERSGFHCVTRRYLLNELLQGKLLSSYKIS
jgi:hypothetical protein